MSGFVALAVYRPDRELLARQVLSLREQELQDWTCLAGMDGPDDDVRTYLESLVAGDPRFSVVEFPERVGFYRNFERLLLEAPDDAAWVALCDQDDRWATDKLSVLVPLLSDGVTAVVGAAAVVDPDGRILASRTRRRRSDLLGLLFDNQVTGSLALFSMSAVATALPFPEPTAVSYHDHWLAVCAEAQGHVVFVDRVVQDYVQHGANAIGEERGVRIVARVRRLLRSAGGAGRAVRHLSADRWGARVIMARTLSSRLASPPTQVRAALDLAARGRASWALLGALALRTARGWVRPSRAVALGLGALVWRDGEVRRDGRR